MSKAVPGSMGHHHPIEKTKSFLQRLLDGIERVGNKVPHPVIIFLILIGIVIVLSQILYMMGASATYEVYNPDTHEIEKTTTAVKSLLTSEGIRYMYAGVIPNFMSFNAVGVIIVAMLGVGVAEESGLIKALIRKLVIIAPPKLFTYILVFIGIISSIAADAGYLVLIPLAAAAFLSVGRHPLAGLAASFGAVAAVFTINIVIKPLDGILVEITNDAIHIVNPNLSIGLASNLWFSIASVFLLTIVVTLITEKYVEPRLGKYEGGEQAAEGPVISAQEKRGLKYTIWGLIGVLVFFGVLWLPKGAPLRNATTGAAVADSPFMNGLIAFIAIAFFVIGACYGVGAGTLNDTKKIVKAMEKAVSGLGGLIFLLFVISQFLAFFAYSNMATVAAVKAGDWLEKLGLGPIPLLVGFVFIVGILDIVMTGAIPKWAIFAPIFVPLMMRLGMKPDAVLAAYRVGDSPINSITPMNPYFALIVGFAMKYQKDAGVGTVISMMLPYVVVLFVIWTLLLVLWEVLGLPWGV